ncbi:methyl-accepting chemotaxis protein [Sphingosinicella terrae]|uniref:methyl-accepting chemotaxis protein n=1 Tax=Sphingosinicella terrae TaxID=2172047 RepID=UPI000E0D2D2B|nr:methyl-accepting chemotaxis protein [Sphingosinicella terrae]
MFSAMSIPRKLGFSFLAICASAAIMMIVFYMAIASIRSSTDSNNLSQSIYAKALTLETSVLRQNSQFRGFLVTADESYLNSYFEARDEYDRTSAELESLLDAAAQRELVLTSRRETEAWRRNWGDRLIAWTRQGRRDAAQDAVRAGGASVLISKPVLPLRELRDGETEEIELNSARQESAISTAMTTLAIGGIFLIGISVILAMLLSRLIARPISGLTRSMADLAAGKNDIAVPDSERKDELGDMARAVLVFRDAAVAKQASDTARARAETEQKMVVESVATHLSELAGGNLTAEIDADFPAEYAAVKTNFNAAIVSLRELIGSVMETTSTISTGSNEIAQASENLARRTEANAASIEQTSAAVTQMDERIKATAEAATKTVQRADGAIATVTQGRNVADEAVQAMGRVAESAKGIDSVIEGLDKIAFQTRVLAMNAAVEAGRAGEAGRGFAVVADLVSALAMRSEEEAARARGQLTATQTDIVAAVEMVQKVDGALADISGDVGEVHDLLARIAVDNQAQSTAITEVSAAMGSMDQSTQQNAAMVEETSAAARNLASEVAGLSEQASRFTVDGRSGGASLRPSARITSAPFRPLPAAAVPALVRPGAGEDDDWREF